MAVSSRKLQSYRISEHFVVNDGCQLLVSNKDENYLKESNIVGNDALRKIHQADFEDYDGNRQVYDHLLFLDKDVTRKAVIPEGEINLKCPSCEGSYIITKVNYIEAKMYSLAQSVREATSDAISIIRDHPEMAVARMERARRMFTKISHFKLQSEDYKEAINIHTKAVLSFLSFGEAGLDVNEVFDHSF